MTHQPTQDEYAPYYHTYIQKVPEVDLFLNLRHIHHETQELLANMSEDKGNYRYAEGKWTVKEVLIHLIDTEQIMAYRALSIARKDQTSLPGFDQNAYVEAVDVSGRTLKSLAEEYAITRDLSYVMFQHFDAATFERVGIANGNKMSVRALAHIILGHEIHHRNVLIEKYLNDRR